ncbi:Secreted protein [Pseudomonas sp. IT-P218]
MKRQCVVTYQVWLKPAGKYCQSLGGKVRKNLTTGGLESGTSPFWGLFHFRSVSRIPGSPEPVFFYPEILGDT